MSSEINLSVLASTAAQVGRTPLVFGVHVSSGAGDAVYKALDAIRDIARGEKPLSMQSQGWLLSALSVLTDSGVQLPPEVEQIFRLAHDCLVEIVGVGRKGDSRPLLDKAPAVVLADSPFLQKRDVLDSVIVALGLKRATREDVKRITGVDKRDLISHRSMESVFVSADSSRLYLLEIIGDGHVSLTRYLPRFEPIDPTDFERDFIEPLGGLGIGQLFYVQRTNGISETIEALWDSVSGEWFITGGREPDRVQVVGEEGGTLHPEEDALDILEADNSGDILEGVIDPEEVEDEMPEEKEVPPTLDTSPFPGQLTGVKTGILEHAFQTKPRVPLALVK